MHDVRKIVRIAAGVGGAGDQAELQHVHGAENGADRRSFQASDAPAELVRNMFRWRHDVVEWLFQPPNRSGQSAENELGELPGEFCVHGERNEVIAHLSTPC